MVDGIFYLDKPSQPHPVARKLQEFHTNSTSLMSHLVYAQQYTKSFDAVSKDLN